MPRNVELEEIANKSKGNPGSREHKRCCQAGSSAGLETYICWRRTYTASLERSDKEAFVFTEPLV